MRESFVFYQSFYEALKELPDDVRLKLYDMISVYALTGEEVECSGIERAVFSLIKPQIKANNQRYLNGCNAAEMGARGGRPRKPQENPNDNPEETPRKPQNNPKKTPNENDNVNVNVNDIPPLFISPPGEEKTDCDLFFETYPRYAKDKAKMRKDVDYKVLLKEFDRSTYLRSLYTVKQINDIYALIKTGDYRDKVDVLVEKAKRESWYTNRRNKAQDNADKLVAMFMQNDVFKTASKRLRELDIEIVKCELSANNGDDAAKKRLAKLTSEQATLTAKRRGIIERQGMSEEDLEPKWFCKKCSDKGYLPDGRVCDCYEKEG